MNTEPVAEWNLREIVRKKNARIASLIPGALYRYAERIVHQDEVNQGLRQLHHLSNVDWMQGGIDYLGLRIEVRGRERIPQDGRNTFVANHPTGTCEGMAFFTVLAPYFDELRSVSNAFLQHFPNISDLYVPINMLGGRDKDSLRAVEQLYASSAQVINFPSGAVSRRFSGRIVDPEWKKSFVTHSVRHQRRIVPVHISGRNSEFFYRVSWLRRSLGIRAPYELFFLIDEMFRHRGDTLRFTFGTPIAPERLDRGRRDKEWSELIRAYVYALEQEPELSFEDFLVSPAASIRAED